MFRDLSSSKRHSSQHINPWFILGINIEDVNVQNEACLDSCKIVLIVLNVFHDPVSSNFPIRPRSYGATAFSMRHDAYHLFYSITCKNYFCRNSIKSFFRVFVESVNQNCCHQPLLKTAPIVFYPRNLTSGGKRTRSNHLKTTSRMISR
jgi:hypothetical protein